jgi:hypothetical protein
MALTGVTYENHNFGTNRIGGTGIGSNDGQGIYTESSTPKYALGEKLELADGRVFRYGYTGAAVKAGLLVAPDVSATSLASSDNIVIAASGDYSPAAGSSKLQITLASITANQYAGGLLQINNDLDDGKGEGIQYRIKSNSATGATTSGKVDIELYDPIKVALDTASDIFIQGNQYNQLITATTTDILVAGVSPIAFTANYYGWFQTAGIATVLMEQNGSSAVPAIGDNLTLGDGTGGACQLKDAETEPLVGIACSVGTTGAFIGVILRLGEV